MKIKQSFDVVTNRKLIIIGGIQSIKITLGLQKQ